MEFDDYKQCIIYTVLSDYPDYLVRQVLKRLEDKKIIVNTKKISKDKITDGRIDVSSYRYPKDKLKHILKQKDKEVLKAIEETEFYKSYRHSIVFRYSGFEEKIINELNNNGQVKLFSSELDKFDSVDFILKKGSTTTFVND
jgi:hypothetical protein